jgi:hypothetical protein
MTENEKQLQQEREKLNRLVEESLQKGIPINKTHAISDQFRRIKRVAGETLRNNTVRAQSRRVDRLVVQVMQEREPET